MRYTSSALMDWAEDLKKRIQLGLERGVQHVEAQRAGKRGAGEERPGQPSAAAVASTAAGQVVTEAEDLPVVSRLVVEIRSDGTRTVARGALEDLVTGERRAIEARGDSPAQLATALAGSLLTAPLRLGRVAGDLLSARLRRGR